MLISQATASNTASIDWALPEGFDRFRIIGEAFLPATDGATCVCQLSTDGGSNYIAENYLTAGVYANTFGIAQLQAGVTVSKNYLYLAALSWGNATGEGASFIAKLYGHKSGLYPRVTAECGGKTAAGAITAVRSTSQYIGGTERITHIRIRADSGNLASGKFFLYGE